MLFNQFLSDFRQLFAILGHFEFETEDLFVGVLEDELLYVHEAAAYSDHKHSVDDLGRDDPGPEEILARVYSVNGHLHLMGLHEFLKHLVHDIVIYTLVLDLH